MVRLRDSFGLILTCSLALSFFSCKLIDDEIKGNFGGPDEGIPGGGSNDSQPGSGEPSSPPSSPQNSLVGSLDLTFNSLGYVVYQGAQDSVGSGVAVDVNSRVLVGGTYNTAGGILSSARVWAYDSVGAVDASFATGGYYDDTVSNYVRGNSLFIDSLGKIVMGGYKEWGGRDDPTYWVLNLDGSLFASVTNSLFSGAEVEGSGITEDRVNGGYFQVGRQYHNYMTISKKTYGLADATSFGGTGRVSFSSIPYSAGWGVKVDSNGRPVILGESSPTNSTANYDLTIWRYNTNGTLDTSFNGLGYLTHDGAAGSSGSQEYAGSLAIDSSGNIFITGSSYNGTDYDMVIWKIRGVDGSLDTTFNGTGYKVFQNAGPSPGNDRGQDILIDTEGNLLVAGSGQDSGGFSDACIWKLSPSGQLDNSFSSDGIFCLGNIAGGNQDDWANALTMDLDGRILVTGQSYNGVRMNMYVMRIK